MSPFAAGTVTGRPAHTTILRVKRSFGFSHTTGLAVLLLSASGWLTAQQQQTGAVEGVVTLRSGGTPLHNATVSLLPTGRTAASDERGEFRFQNVPPGRYRLVAHMHSLTDETKLIEVQAGQTAKLDFALSLAPVRESITVTATGQEVATAQAFQTVTSRESYDLTIKASNSLGELLETETGIAKRSFGPGNSRPVVRGFDGDRVLVLQDGVRTGTLSSQSGDHGEPVDATSIERVEVVRGPATLLYGSNAVGGVVNVVTGHHLLHEHPHSGFRGHLTGIGGTTNAQGGGSGGFEFGHKDWLVWGSGGGMRTGDYHAPIGRIVGSGTELRHTTAGFGRYSEKFGFNLSYGVQDGKYGVPFASEFHEHHEDEDVTGEEDDHGEEEQIGIQFRRHNVRFNGSVRDLGRGFESFQLALNYSDWNHKELEGAAIGTEFFNTQFIYRGTLTQRRRGPLSGSFGFWGMRRDFEARGEEALAPPVSQNAFALFGLEEFSFERVRFQFGGRFEHNGYSPEELRNRSFNGASGSAGVFLPAWNGGAVVVNYMHSFRAPALEELYNLGPHVGNVTYEIGNPNLVAERSNAFEVSLRHTAQRVRLETNFFRYGMRNFVYLQPTGAFEDGLPEADYAQADARFLGAEMRSEIGLRRDLWLLLGFDAVDAQLTAGGTPLPRIPPVRGRIGADWRWRSLSIRPELVLANRQWQLAPNETETPGYAVVNLAAAYTFTQKHTMHTFQANLFNLSDRLYRNHLSFIKDLAPEIGRGVRFTYTLQWF